LAKAQQSLKHTTLVLVGHGSRRNPDSCRTTYLHGEAIRERGLFAGVREGFLKQDPTLEDVLASLSGENVILVPLMACGGYITNDLLPRKLAESGVDKGAVTAPVGTHAAINSMMTARLDAFFQAQNPDPSNVAVLVAGHGSTRSRESFIRTGEVAEALGGTAVFLEEEPFLRDWQQIADNKMIAVLPFLMAGGLHGAEDVPALLGVDPDDTALDGLESSKTPAGPFSVEGREVYLFRPLGYEPALTDVIIERVKELP